MSQKIFLRLLPGNDTHAEWMVFDNFTVALATLEEISSYVRDKTCTVLVPTLACYLTTAIHPPVPSHKALKIIPFLIEEELSADLADLHFALSEGKANEPVTVAVVRTSQMEHWLQLLHQHHIQPVALIPDVFAVPHIATHGSIWMEADQILMRSDERYGFACSLDNFDLLTQAIQEQEPKLTHVDLYQVCAQAPPPFSHSIPATLHESKVIKLLQLFVKNNSENFKLNLLQGKYKPKTKWIPAGKTLRLVIIAFIVWGISSVLNQSLHLIYYKKQQAQLDVQIEDLYRQIFPEATTVTSPYLRLQQELTKIQEHANDGGLLLLLSKLGTDFQTLQLHNLSYANNTLTLAITTADFKSLQNLLQKLAVNVHVQQKNAKRTDHGVDAELIVRLKS